LFDQILEKVEAMPSKSRVALTGYVPDEFVPPLFREAQLFILPSITEGFGLPVLEALSIGVPVVCSNGGAVPEVGGEVPVYFDPMSADAIVSGIEEGLRRLENRSSWIEAGKRQAQQFDWDKCAEKMMETMLPLARR
jgi:glycosyltransferase involved in cell wall biosynthesis